VANITGTDKRDVLSGTDGRDILVGLGDADYMLGSARGGNDKVGGGKGDDFLVGDAFFILGSARGGNDRLDGGKGNDTLFGDAGGISDGQGGALYDDARGGSDSLHGGGGGDLLIGDDGDDRLTGGGGADRFLFLGDFGRDTVTDFSAVEGDTLEFIGYTAGDLTLDERPGRVVITADDNQLVVRGETVGLDDIMFV
jgi:Ca2+-binding RTX toxin-like protein